MNKQSLSVTLSTLFGVGNFPKAPGTWGSIIAFLVYLVLPEMIFQNYIYQVCFAIFILLGTIISVFLTTNAEKVLGHDDGSIVIDEFFGYFIGVLFFKKSIFTGFFILLFFRFFDIRKPYPINLLQKLPKGWGIMLDDSLAGLFSAISYILILTIIRRFSWIF